MSGDKTNGRSHITTGSGGRTGESAITGGRSQADGRLPGGSGIDSTGNNAAGTGDRSRLAASSPDERDDRSSPDGRDDRSRDYRSSLTARKGRKIDPTCVVWR